MPILLETGMVFLGEIWKGSGNTDIDEHKVKLQENSDHKSSPESLAQVGKKLIVGILHKLYTCMYMHNHIKTVTDYMRFYLYHQAIYQFIIVWCLVQQNPHVAFNCLNFTGQNTVSENFKCFHLVARLFSECFLKISSYFFGILLYSVMIWKFNLFNCRKCIYQYIRIYSNLPCFSCIKFLL